MTGSWKGRGNQYIEFVRDVYSKLPTNGKQLPAFPFEAVPGIEPRPQRLQLCHRGPWSFKENQSHLIGVIYQHLSYYLESGRKKPTKEKPYRRKALHVLIPMKKSNAQNFHDVEKALFIICNLLMKRLIITSRGIKIVALTTLCSYI